MSSILLKNVRAIDEKLDKQCDILIEDGIIKKLAKSAGSEADNIYDCAGLIAVPGLFDMHVHFRDPGFTYKEDILTGAASALYGGFTGVACMPNTDPAIDNPETINYIIEKGKYTGVKIYPIAAITEGLRGEKLCEYPILKKSGAIAVSDDGRPVECREVLKNGMLEAEKSGLTTISHCEDLTIIKNGKMNKGKVSEELGIPGMDRLSEDSITKREILVSKETGCRIHIAHVSTRGSTEIIRQYKKAGVKVTCETCPHYFMMTDEMLRSLDADYRMNPPLREESDRLSVIEGICDGTIDCIVTDHAPHSKKEKSDFINAPNGVVGLETSLGAVLTGLYHTGKITLNKVVQLMSANPRRILGIPVIKISEGTSAEITLIDTEKKWTVDPEKFKSKASNSAFKNMELKGKAVGVISDGRMQFFER